MYGPPAGVTLLLKPITPSSSKSRKLGFKLEGIMSGVLLVEELNILAVLTSQV